MEDFLLIEIPFFKPQYKRGERYGYKKRKEKDNLKNVLSKSTGGYCMYCYSRVYVDKKLYAHLEHAIEKNNSDKLVECIPNIGLSCSLCNQTFKRIGEQKRKIQKNNIEQFEKASTCPTEKSDQCTISCKALRELQKDYNNLPDAEILLQPMGVIGSDSNETLALQYNVIKMKFEPVRNADTYSDREIQFIEAHIQRFRLNDPQYRSRQLFDFVKNVIDNNGKIPVYEYNNLIVKLFCKKISDKPQDERLKICERIFVIAYHRM